MGESGGNVRIELFARLEYIMRIHPKLPEMSIEYGKPEVSVSYPDGIPATDLWLSSGIHTYCAGPGGFVWFIPLVTDPTEMGDLWQGAVNCREEDEWHNGDAVPGKIELAHWTVSFALSIMDESLHKGLSVEESRRAGLWISEMIAWDQVYVGDESGLPDLSGKIPTWVNRV